MAYDEQRRVAEGAARRAGEVLLGHYRRVTAREKAGPGDLVTEADTAAQRAILGILREAFPDHTLLAEEEGVVPDPENPWRWIVDPLDGTVNYAHAIPPWGVSIGLEHEKELVVGVIYFPLEDRMFSAARGAGTTENGQPVRVSAAARLSDSLIAASFPASFPEGDRQMAMMDRMSRGTHSVRRYGSSAWNLAMIACGSAEVCYATAMCPWDAAGGIVLIREAGGLVTGLDGSPHDLYREDILATNGHVHEEALAALKESWPAGG